MITRPSTVHNQQLWLKHCRKVRALAQRIIGGQVGIIDGSRQMLTYKYWLHAGDDPDFLIFKVVDSETHNIPVGKVREHWSAEALQEQDIKGQKIENLYRARAIDAAARIQRKYEA